MQLGLGVLQLPPEAFWRMTTPEWRAALEGYCRAHGFDGWGAESLSREDFAALQQMFPDVIKL